MEETGHLVTRTLSMRQAVNPLRWAKDQRCVASRGPPWRETLARFAQIQLLSPDSKALAARCYTRSTRTLNSIALPSA